jgi:hypothetical protein
VNFPSFPTTGAASPALRSFLDEDGEGVWTGFGASYALAAAVVGTLQRLGFGALLRRPRAAGSGKSVALVSRACRVGGETFGLVIGGTEACNRVSGPCLAILDGDIGNEWFPSKFHARALGAVAAQFGVSSLPLLPLQDLDCISARPLLVVTDDCADEAQLLTTSAWQKFRDLRIHAVPLEDFPHGPHSHVVSGAAVVLIRTSDSVAVDSVVAWLTERNVPMSVADLRVPEWLRPLAIQAWALKIIEAHAVARGIDLASPQLSLADDGLRDTIAVFGQGL